MGDERFQLEIEMEHSFAQCVAPMIFCCVYTLDMMWWLTNSIYTSSLTTTFSISIAKKKHNNRDIHKSDRNIKTNIKQHKHTQLKEKRGGDKQIKPKQIK